MLKKIIVGLTLIFIVIQFNRPTKNISTELPISDFLAFTGADANIA